MTVAITDSAVIKRAGLPSVVIGAVALAFCAVGSWFSPIPAFRGYLAAYLFFLGLALGSLALDMIHHLTGGAWGLLVRGVCEAQMQTLPLLAVLFIPILFGLHHVYPWAAPHDAPLGEYPRFREIYLDRNFFVARSVAYFGIWSALAWLLTAWSRKQDRSGDVRWAWRCHNLSGPGLVVYGVTLHFAAIDWLMSAENGFTSTVFGPIVAAGQLLSAFAFSFIVFASLVMRPEVSRVTSLKALNDVGSLLLALLVTWAYLVWFQIMLIWMADLPRDNMWYLARFRGGWRWITGGAILVQFAIPFLLLLFRAVKQEPRALACVAALILFGQLVFSYEQLLPSFRESPVSGGWSTYVAPLGIGGLWFALVSWLLARRPLVPLCDRSREHALRFRRLDERAIARESELKHG
jgi:hypothetical protein